MCAAWVEELVMHHAGHYFRNIICFIFILVTIVQGQYKTGADAAADPASTAVKLGLLMGRPSQ